MNTMCVKIRAITLINITKKHIIILHLAILFWSLNCNGLMSTDLSSTIYRYGSRSDVNKNDQ